MLPLQLPPGVRPEQIAAACAQMMKAVPGAVWMAGQEAVPSTTRSTRLPAQHGSALNLNTLCARRPTHPRCAGVRPGAGLFPMNPQLLAVVQKAHAEQRAALAAAQAAKHAEQEAAKAAQEAAALAGVPLPKLAAQQGQATAGDHKEQAAAEPAANGGHPAK